MLIKKQDITELSNHIRKAIDGQTIDFRDNKEGPFSILKNDIHTLITLKNEQANSFLQERDYMSDSLANISHQLKTPLTSMMVMADLLETTPLDKQLEFITNIQISLKRMDFLVSSLLKLAKLDNGTVPFSRNTMFASNLVEMALDPLRILLDINNQTVQLMQDTSITCDKRWTAEALTNIIKNASEHSPNGSIITINCGSNPICTWISVTNSGERIPKEKIATIFKRFEGSISDQSYGIGLPLALAIIRNQNGDIDVDCGDQTGKTTFTLKLYQ